MPDRRTVLGAAKKRFSSRDLALIASFAALIAVLGVPGKIDLVGPVPITLQSMGIMLAGSILGWKRGALSVLLFVALVAAGLPLLAGGRGGPALFVGPTAGFLVGYIFGAGVVGWLVQRRLPAYPVWWGAAANSAGGIGVVYLFGIIGMSLTMHTSLLVAATASMVFLPGDAIKVVIATTVASAVHRAIPGITDGNGSAKAKRVRQPVSAR
jgi:biotin transport system substrate-specific component